MRISSNTDGRGTQERHHIFIAMTRRHGALAVRQRVGSALIWAGARLIGERPPELELTHR